MITVRRAHERQHTLRRKHQAWLTFFSQDGANALADGFGNLETLDEDLLPPGAVVRNHAGQYAETVTYVREGALTYENSLGGSGVIHAGEFQRMISGRGIRHRKTNASRNDWAHVFQIGLRPTEAGLEPSHEHKRFSVADRRGELCIVAAPDARRGSLRIHQDALMYSALLERGQHVVHELSQGRNAWLHLVHGEVTLGDIVLTAGDGAGVTAERAVSVTARQDTEILLLDLVQQRRGRPMSTCCMLNEE